MAGPTPPASGRAAPTRDPKLVAKRLGRGVSLAQRCPRPSSRPFGSTSADPVLLGEGEVLRGGGEAILEAPQGLGHLLAETAGEDL
jgi:hypothetical protein